jgi:hypothetical protein
MSIDIPAVAPPEHSKTSIQTGLDEGVTSKVTSK